MINSESSDRDPIEELADQFTAELRLGSVKSVEQFASRYPVWANQIHKLFPLLVLIESGKSCVSAIAQDVSSSDASLSWIDRELSDFRIIREVGRGGMGVVFEAEQLSLRRRVALKVLPPRLADSVQYSRRFQREAVAAARLHHTNIIPVFSHGRYEDTCFFSMQFIDGCGLDESLKHTRPPRQQCDLRGNWIRIAEIGRQVASALQYAHEQGVLHRDIKPANLILDSSNIAWVADFGLSKTRDDDDLTADGGAVGTLRYMAPEQLNGNCDERSDVYSLGLTLYELLTWQPAFNEPTRGELLWKISNQKPLAPRRVDPSIPRDLETIVLKAIASQPKDRYQSAGELEADLVRYLSGQTLNARRTNLREQLWRWSKRNPATAALTCATVLLLWLTALISVLAYDNTNDALAREKRLHQTAKVAQLRADLERKRAEMNFDMALSAFNEIRDDLAATHSRSTVATALDIDNEPQYSPSLSRGRAVMLRKLLRFYSEFASKNGESGDLKSLLISVHRQVASIQGQLGQFDESEVAYAQAIELLESHSCPDEERVSCHAAISNELGRLHLSTGRLEDAHDLMSATIERLQTHRNQAPNSLQTQYELARSYQCLAELYHVRGDIRLWQDYADKAIANLSELAKLDPKSTAFRFQLACAYRDTPPFIRTADGLVRNVEGHEQATVLLSRLGDEFPENLSYRYELSRLYARVHLWKPKRARGSDLGERELAVIEKRLRRALSLARELVHAEPSVPMYSHLLAQTQRKMAMLFERREVFVDAEKLASRAVFRLSQLATKSPNMPIYQDALATAKHVQGRILFRQGSLAYARVLIEESIALRKQFLAIAPNNRRSREQLEDQLLDLSRIISAVGTVTAQSH